MRVGLSARIFLGFLAILATFAGTLLFATGRIQAIREDLRLVHRGYLTLTRQAAQVRTLQEAKDEYVRRARKERDPAVRRHLVGYAREFYPRALRDRLAEMLIVAESLASATFARGDHVPLEDLKDRIRRVQALHDAYDDATVRLLESLERIPDQNVPTLPGDAGGTAVEAPGDAAAQAPGDAGAAHDAAPHDAGAPAEPAEPGAPPTGPPGADPTLLAFAFERASEALSQEVRGLSVALEGRIAEALLGAERDVRDASFAALGLSLVALFVGLGILFMMNRALRPLQLLLDSARAIGRGSLDVEVPSESDDEVGALAREFNAMTRALKDRERALASRNEELLRLKHFSDDVIRSIRIGIVILDREGRVQGLNPAARSVFHLPLIDLEGRALAGVEDLAGPLAEVLTALDEVHGSGEVRTFPLLGLHERIVDVALVPIRDRAGASLSEVLLLGEDVTVREETRERLLRSERLAAIGRLAAQITHEIRNPLSSIGLNIELLEDDVPHLPDERQGEARAILGAVAREVDRLAQITEGYLRYARLPAPKRVEGDVGDLLADLCAFSQEEAARAGVMLELQVEDTLPGVPHDPPRLRQALLNLLRNAEEAAGRGGTVRLKAERLPDGGVRVSIEDSGPGVPGDVKERLFEPFFTTKPQGTGLGLTLTREIVTEHGGTLGLDDSPLGGAAFRIDLPSAPAREDV